MPASLNAPALNDNVGQEDAAGGFRALANKFHQLGRSYAQPMRKLHDIEQADVPFPALDPAHIVPIRFRQFLP
jgi:hypothetical protein